MTPLRAKMIKAMQVRGFSVRTHESYLYAVTDLARYFHRSPDQLGIDDLRRYFEYLATERSLSGATCRLFLNGIRFLYLQVLGWSSFDVDIPIPKKAQRIPELLTRAEVSRILAACANPKHRMMLTLCYGCGLRLRELVSLKVRDIDGERRLLRVEQGKGAKDRLVPLSDTLLTQLRVYWRLFRPCEWLFPGHTRHEHLSETCIQKAFTQAKAQAGIKKIGGIHGLRHAYATHQLEAGLPVTYHHLVVTLPHDLNPWVQFHPEVIYGLLFETVWATLSAFAADPKRLGGQLGMTAVLHTWGQTLSQHVHLHCRIPGGAFSPQGE